MRSWWSDSRLRFSDRLPPSLALVILFLLLTKEADAASSPGGWSTGTAQLSSWTTMPEIPDIITEWAALIPLTIYLSNTKTLYDLAGEVSLRARLSISLIPRLWELGSVAKLLLQREAFLDTSSSMGDPLKVYDVQWGSIFPCYNSAATASVAADALRKLSPTPEITLQHLSKWIREHDKELDDEFPTHGTSPPGRPVSRSETFCGEEINSLIKQKETFGRAQQLTVIVFSSSASAGRQHSSSRQLRAFWTRRAQMLGLFLLTAVSSGIMLSLGCYGTGLILLIGGVSYVCSQLVHIKRSPLYLRSREVHQGCMLVAAHDNATSWTVYLGNYGAIDSLLNKPMVEICKVNSLVLGWFRFAELLQIAAMTYVAGQKGWDAVFLLIMILSWSVIRFYTHENNASAWLRREGLSTTAFRCEFAGRTELLGAVQLLSTEKRTLWMDGILSPVQRRNVWLEKIGAVDSCAKRLEHEYASLSSHDRSWVRATGMYTIAGYNLIHQKLSSLVGVVAPNRQDSSLSDDSVNSMKP